MLTRIEINGFKTFNDFALDVPPFLAVIGPNASGKSNLFDAIQFLRRVTEENLARAVDDARGDVEELFRRRGDGTTVDEMSFAVETLLDPRVRDPWGTQVELTQTRLRYELCIEKRIDEEGGLRLFVTREDASPIPKSKDLWRNRFRPSPEFTQVFFRDGRRRSAFLETVEEERGRTFSMRQDGVAGRARPAESAEATVLSSVSSADFKHLYALREEILGWRFLQLDPMSLRLPGERFGEDRLDPTGSNLARVLHRIQAETATDQRPTGSLADISTDLASLIDDVKSVQVVENEQTRKWEIRLDSVGEGRYSAGVASDGTLRVLALLTALYDPKYRGLVCFEEPENGVHPLRLKQLIQYLHNLSADIHATGVEVDDGLAQVILSSHSPVVLRALHDDEAVVLDSVSLIDPKAIGGGRSRVSRVRRVSRVAEATPMMEALRGIAGVQEIHLFEAAALLEEAV